MTLFWVCTIIVLATASVAQGVGVNWGSFVSHPLPFKITIQMLKDNGIDKVKLFESFPDVLGALAGSGLQVMIGVPNEHLADFGKMDNARNYVKQNVSVNMKSDGGVDIRLISVGNEPFLKDYGDEFADVLLPAMENVQKALDEAGLGDKTKVTTALNGDFISSTPPNYLPSDADIRPDIKDKMISIMKFLKENDSPLVVNIYPFFSAYQDPNFPLDECFYDNKKITTDKDKSYNNMFDLVYDQAVWSLEKNDFKDLNITVGEIGWPTDGVALANVTLAKRFYDGFMANIHNNTGTPMRPGPMDVFLFGLFDEDIKAIKPGQFERHWGIFTYDGKGKFPIDLNGKGPDRYPAPAKGISYLKQQWCALKDDVSDMDAVKEAVNYTCQRADCTSIEKGASCSFLDDKEKASFAFNRYFQQQDQSSDSCDFKGLARVVTTNASKKTCVFHVELDLNKMTKEFGPVPNGTHETDSGPKNNNAGDRLNFAYGTTILGGILLYLFGIRYSVL